MAISEGLKLIGIGLVLILVLGGLTEIISGILWIGIVGLFFGGLFILAGLTKMLGLS